MNLTGNTLLITGGTSGIGRALAEAFHGLGNRVIVAGRRQSLLDEIVEKNPGMVGIPVDLDDAAAVDAFAADVRTRFPDLNVLINNAGISRREDLASGDADISVARSILQTNVVSVLQLTAALLPTLRAQPASTVVTTTSGLAFLPSAFFPTYCASKAFLHSWLQSLRFQLRDTSVEVLELIPPYVQTELSGVAQATDPRAVPLDDYVKEVMGIIGQPDLPGGEILVEAAKGLRWAERNGTYEETYAAYHQSRG
ncbi:SDR family NAD(P)-dependent oxidoreductase [bacterium]|nr:MAG: SDR family NAD(P)-dependent oxidoreductase [bacterium]